MDIEVKRRDPKSSHAVGTESYEEEVEALIGQNKVAQNKNAKARIWIDEISPYITLLQAKE